jgi:hypothetical protein
MKLLDMPAIECRTLDRSSTKIFIPGGWKAYVGEISIDAETLRAYARVIGDTNEALELHQQLYEKGYMVALRLAIARRAQRYHELFPKLAQPLRRDFNTTQKYVTLLGFDPAALQSTFIPYERPGRGGNPLVDETLREMGQTVKAA